VTGLLAVARPRSARARKGEGKGAGFSLQSLAWAANAATQTDLERIHFIRADRLVPYIQDQAFSKRLNAEDIRSIKRAVMQLAGMDEGFSPIKRAEVSR
jgi:hypothetical protein